MLEVEIAKSAEEVLLRSGTLYAGDCMPRIAEGHQEIRERNSRLPWA